MTTVLVAFAGKNGGTGEIAEAIDAEPTVTFGGRLDRTTARGVLPRLMASGSRAGDFRDWDRIRHWARDLGGRLRTSVSL